MNLLNYIYFHYITLRNVLRVCARHANILLFAVNGRKTIIYGDSDKGTFNNSCGENYVRQTFSMLHNHVGVAYTISIKEYKHWLFALYCIGFSEMYTHMVM